MFLNKKSLKWIIQKEEKKFGYKGKILNLNTKI